MILLVVNHAIDKQFLYIYSSSTSISLFQQLTQTESYTPPSLLIPEAEGRLI
jgi:hypothetical protein